jgi:hypothetical protein
VHLILVECAELKRFDTLFVWLVAVQDSLCATAIARALVHYVDYYVARWVYPLSARARPIRRRSATASRGFTLPSVQPTFVFILLVNIWLFNGFLKRYTPVVAV